MDDRGGEAERILLLEHSEPAPATDRGDLADTLLDAGFDVERLTTATDCIRALTDDDRDVDAIVAEHAPPHLDGLHLLRSVRVGQPSLPVVLLPRERTDSIAGDAIAAGVSGYVSPTEDAVVTVERLRSALDRDGQDESPGDDRYRHLVEISPVPINLFDEAGECIWGNDAVLDLLGLEDHADLVGRSIFEFVHPEDRETARGELETVIESKQSVGPTRMKLVPAGTEDVRHVRVATAVGDLLGASIGQAIVVDETDRELRQRHLAVLDTWLRHNIRNELNVIQGLAAAVADGRAEDAQAAARDVREAADHLVGQADRQRRLIHLLRSPPDPVPIELDDLLERRVAHAHRTYPDATIRLEATGAVPIEAVPELEDAVGELLENAIQHGRRGASTVDCVVERRAADAVLRIRDDGPGIPAAERDLLFLDREIDQIHHGSGLGLVFVYWAVQLSAGTLSFDVNDRGTTVTVTIPVTAGE